MIKVLINGACGRMGCEVEKLVDAAEDMKAAAKVDKMADKSGCYSDINDFDGEADVIGHGWDVAFGVAVPAEA